jgi:hypothetical protein
MEKKYLVRAADWRTPLISMKTYQNAPLLMLLRTEVIGLNAWLVSIRVLDILPRYKPATAVGMHRLSALS